MAKGCQAKCGGSCSNNGDALNMYTELRSGQVVLCVILEESYVRVGPILTGLSNDLGDILQYMS